jgi:glycosyltransferase 2 family protein
MLTDKPPFQDPLVPSEPDAEPPSLGKRLLNVRSILSLIFGLAVAAIALWRISGDASTPGQIVAQLASADPLLYLIAFVVYYCTFPIRALRWRLLLRNVGYREDLGVQLPGVASLSVTVLLSWFANCLLPAKLGDAYRGYLLKQGAGVSFARTMGTILAERIVDTLLLFVLMALAAALTFHGALPPIVQRGVELGVVLVTLVVVALLAVRRYGQEIHARLPERFQRHYRRLVDGTLNSFSLRVLPQLVVYSVLVWGVEAGRLYFVTQALGLRQLPLHVVLFVALAGALLTTVPLTPGGLGAVEAGIAGVLILVESLGITQGIDRGTATSVAILDRSISFWSLIVVGAVVYVLTRRVWRAAPAASRGV